VNIKTKIILFSICAFLFLSLIAGIVILLLPNSNTESVATETAEEKSDFHYGTEGINYDGTLLYQLSISDLEDKSKPLTQIFIYKENTAIINTAGADGKVISHIYELSNEDMQKIIDEMNAVKDGMIENKCSSGYLYSIRNDENKTSYKSCGSCEATIPSCYMKVKLIIEKD
jgi:hypothetical protein